MFFSSTKTNAGFDKAPTRDITSKPSNNTIKLRSFSTESSKLNQNRIHASKTFSGIRQQPGREQKLRTISRKVAFSTTPIVVVNQPKSIKPKPKQIIKKQEPLESETNKIITTADRGTSTVRLSYSEIGTEVNPTNLYLVKTKSTNTAKDLRFQYFYKNRNSGQRSIALETEVTKPSSQSVTVNNDNIETIETDISSDDNEIVESSEKTVKKSDIENLNPENGKQWINDVKGFQYTNDWHGEISIFSVTIVVILAALILMGLGQFFVFGNWPRDETVTVECRSEISGNEALLKYL